MTQIGIFFELQKVSHFLLKFAVQFGEHVYKLVGPLWSVYPLTFKLHIPLWIYKISNMTT